MVTRMKTTIDIPDALAEQAKNTARRDGATLRELVVAGLRSEIARREAAQDVGFHFPTASGEGLVADVAADAVIDLSYGLPG